MSPSQCAGAALVAFGATEFVLRRGSTAKTFKAGASDRGTTVLIFGSYALVVILLFVKRLPGPAFPEIAAWSFVGIAFAGLALRWWAMLVLGRFYTRTLVTATDQVVVTRGPYGLVRHPGYLGSLMTWIGVAGASRNIVAPALVAAVLLAVYVRRMNAEEAMLRNELGPGYAAYQQRSWRLLPFIY